MDNDKYYIKVQGVHIEVSHDVYLIYQQSTAHEKYLERKDLAKGVVCFSALDTEEVSGEDTIPDNTASVEEKAISNILVSQLHDALTLLDDDEFFLLRELYFMEKTEAEVGNILGISQPAVSRRKAAIVKKLQKYFKL